MLTRGQLTTAALMLSVAIGIGHVTEYGVAGASRVSTPEPRPAPRMTEAAAIQASPLLSSELTTFNMTSVAASMDILTPAEILRDSLPQTPVSASLESPAVAAPVAKNADRGVANCRARFEVTAVPDGIAEVALDAPCAGNRRVEIHHSGLRISETTDEDGRLRLRIPALSEDARFTAHFPDDARRYMAQVHLPEVSLHDRVALQATGSGAVIIEALTDGAPEIVEISDLDSQDDRLPAGYVVRLGDAEAEDAGSVDIFSYPRRGASRDGVVRLNVKADVTRDTCGRQIPALAVQTLPNGALRRINVDIAIPGCDAVGDTLVLKNILQDLKLASK